MHWLYLALYLLLASGCATPCWQTKAMDTLDEDRAALTHREPWGGLALLDDPASFNQWMGITNARVSLMISMSQDLASGACSE